MQKLIFATALVVLATPAAAQYQRNNQYYGGGFGSNSNDHYVQPHVRRDGSSVEGHYRTNPNNNPYDNFSTRGNVNPYTGKRGSSSPW